MKQTPSESLKPQSISHGRVWRKFAYALIACGPPSNVCRFPSMCISKNDANTKPVTAITNFFISDDIIDFFMFPMILFYRLRLFKK